MIFLDIRAFIAYFTEWLGAVAASWLLSISPRLQVPPVAFKYARRDGLIALSLYALILVFAFIYYAINPSLLPTVVTLAPAPVNPTTQNLFLAAVCLAVIGMALVTRHQPILSIGWKPSLISPGLQMGVAVALLTIFLRNRVMDVLSGVSSAGLAALLLALGISLAEETIFRGYIQLRLASWLGRWQGVLLTSLLFAVWHLPAWLGHLPTPTILILSGLTLGQGLVLGWMMEKSHSVVAPALYRAVSIWMQFIG